MTSRPARPRRSRAFRRLAAVSALGVCLAAAAAFAQGRFFFEGGPRREPAINNIPYDGKFTFVRVKYATAPGGYWAGGRPSWSHGYALAEKNLMKIMNDISYLGAHEDINVLTLDDPELFKYPVAYIIEVGWWTLTDREASALEAYLEKGGFLIVDDFKMPGWRGIPGGGWEPFEANVRRIYPGVRFFDMDPEQPIFHSFFEVGHLLDFPQAYNSGRPVFKGVFEDNDPSKRLLMMINYNTDVSQFWEWSGRGFRPVDQTNEAYKLGVNYFMFGITH